jgi:hypothetical protein
MAFLCQSPYHTPDYRRSLDGDTRGGTVLLRDCLREVHESIITCWNFGDEDKVRFPYDVMRNTINVSD